jgi:hypothetical protein
MKRYILTGVIVALHLSSMLLGQNREIRQQIINTDTFFVMNRQYAQWVLSKFDTLEYVKRKLDDSKEIIGMLNNHTILLNETITKQTDAIKAYEIEVSETNHLIDSYRRAEIINNQVRQSLEKEKKRKSLWKGLAFLGIGSTAVATTMILIILNP